MRELTVKEFIKNHTDEELAFLRILASNKTVYKGRDNQAAATDYTLCVGACQMGYAWHHKERSAAEFIDRGLDLDINDIVGTVNCHKVTVEQIEEAFQKLKAHHDAHKK